MKSTDGFQKKRIITLHSQNNFGQLGCPDFEHKSCNLMSEIGTLNCPDFGTLKLGRPDFRHSLYSQTGEHFRFDLGGRS